MLAPYPAALPTWPTWPTLTGRRPPAAPLPTAADLAADLARLATPALGALLWAVAVAWQVGYLAGALLHWANGRLAALAVAALAPAPPAPASPAPASPAPASPAPASPAPASPAPAPRRPLPPPALHPLADLAAPLAPLSAATLRRVTRSRRRCSKAHLIGDAVALI